MRENNNDRSNYSKKKEKVDQFCTNLVRVITWTITLKLVSIVEPDPQGALVNVGTHLIILIH